MKGEHLHMVVLKYLEVELELRKMKEAPKRSNLSCREGIPTDNRET